MRWVWNASLGILGTSEWSEPELVSELFGMSLLKLLWQLDFRLIYVQDLKLNYWARHSL